ILSSMTRIRKLPTTIAKLFAGKYGKLTAVGLVITLSVIVGLLVTSHAPSSHTKQSNNLSTTEAKSTSTPKLDATDPIAESSSSQRVATGPQLQPKGSVSGPEPAHVSPPFITAHTFIEDTTQPLSPTCDFTAVIT